MQQAVVDVLRATLSPDGSVRAAAEKQLKEWAPQGAFLDVLLQLARSGPDQNVSQSAAAHFKLLVGLAWVEKASAPAGFKWSDQDKELVKSRLVQACVESSSVVRQLLCQGLKLIADVEWPQNWPKLVEELVPMLSFKNFAQEAHRVHGAALCLRLVMRRYQYLTTDVQNRKRWPIHRMAQIILGPYLQMMQQLMGLQSQASIELQLVIVKSFQCMIHEEVPPVLYESPPLVKPWVETLVRVLVTPIPPGMQPADEEERPRFCWWALKKTCAKLLLRVASRHGVPADVRLAPMEPSDDVVAYERGAVDPRAWQAHRAAQKAKKAFAAYFEATLAPPLFQEVLRLTALLATGAYISPRVTVHLLRFVSFGVRQAALWRLLEPSVDAFLRDVVFRLLVLTAHEKRVFYEDAQEFLLLTTELDKVSYSPRLRAMYLLKDVMKLRKKRHLDAFMAFLGARLADAALSPEEKEAVLCALGTLSDELLESARYAPALEALLAQHAFPAVAQGLAARAPPLCWRAVWLLGRFWTVRWQRWGAVLECARHVVECLAAPLLPMRLQAAETLPHLLHLPPVAEAVESVLPLVVQRVVAIAGQTDSDEVMQTLEALTGKYPRQMAPLALQLIPPVLRAFRHAAREHESERAAMSALAALELVVSLVDECAEHARDEGAWRGLEQLLGPFVLELLAMDAAGGFWELGVKLLCALTFEPPFPNGPDLWAALPLMHAAWLRWAKDYTVELAEAWDNFFSNAPARCAASPDVMAAVDQVVRYALRADADLEEREGGLKVLQSVLANLRGAPAPLAQHAAWLGLLFQAIKHETAQDNAENVMELTAAAMLFVWYHPPATLALLEQHQLTAMLVNAVFAQMDEYDTLNVKKLVLLGLTALLHLPAPQLPPSLSGLLPKCAMAALALQADIWEQRDEEERFRQAEEAGLSGFDDDADLATMPYGENVNDDRDVDDMGNAMVDVDFEGDWDDMIMPADGASLCNALDKFDEIDYFLSAVGPQFAHSLKGKDKESFEKLVQANRIQKEKKLQ